MKKIYFLLFLFFSVGVQAQLIVDAGPNHTYCQGDSAVLGGSPAVSGGTPPYTYDWTPGNDLSDSTIANPVTHSLYSRNYTLKVRDAAGDSAQDITNASTNYVSIYAYSVNLSCTGGGNDGSIQISLGGNGGPYTYLWSTGATTQNLQNLTAGVYSITVTSASSLCTASDTITIVQDTVMPGFQYIRPTCPGDSTGVLNIYTLWGATPPFHYLWSTGDTTYTVYNVSAGYYTLTASDALGCSAFFSFNMPDGAPLPYTTSAHNESYPGTCDGMIVLKRGIGGYSPYSYSWWNGSTNDTLSAVCTGTYAFTITDGRGCTVDSTVTVGSFNCLTNTLALALQHTNLLDCTHYADTITAVVSGGTLPYHYSWNTGDTTASIIITNGSIYSVYVQDVNGCSRAAQDTVATLCENIIQGHIFDDTNNNCIQDSGEVGIPQVFIVATDGSSYYYGLSNSSGFYYISIHDSGSYYVSVHVDGTGCSLAHACSGQNVHLSFLGQTVSADFGIGGSPTYNLSLHPGWNNAGPGFIKDYRILYNQIGSYYSGPAVITFFYDSALQYQSSTQGGVHNASAKSITWQVNSVPQQWNWQTAPHAFFLVPVGVPLNYQLHATFTITPVIGDCDSSDNHLTFIQPVTGSMDPNEKEVSPSGAITEEDSVITYTIHFQNTGNDTTLFVVVRDTLSGSLDPASVQNIASSHPYYLFNISEHGILEWWFYPIYLPDSASNADESKGFVMFRIKKKSNLPLGTVISNRASIYFDYNEPVMTNTVSDTISSPIFTQAARAAEDIRISAAPNPFNQSTTIWAEGISGEFEFELHDVAGRLLERVTGINSQKFELKRNALGSGIYFYHIAQKGRQIAVGKLVAE